MVRQNHGGVQVAGLEYIVNAIKQRQQRLAVEGLMTPRAPTEFEFGRLAGQVEGLSDALSIISQALREEEGRAI